MVKSPGKRKPNFLIIMSDEHGACYSSAYGHAFIQTPSMDRLAEEGVTVEEVTGAEKDRYVEPERKARILKVVGLLDDEGAADGE